jgi:phage terminase Nu1 subunit (DNA packaging protein)
MPSKISDRYIGKVNTIALLLLGGVTPKTLQKWYPDMTDSEITKAQRKIERLKLEEVLN